MSPDAEKYKSEVFELVGVRDPIEILGSTLEQMTALVREKGAAALAASPGPGEWSARQVIAHLADAEMVYGVRVRMIIAHDRPFISGYNEKSWAERFTDVDPEPESTIERFRILRENNLRLFATMTEEEWERIGMHEERGPESSADIVRLLAGHDLMHIAQMRMAAGG